jgi:hypothetical protein
VVIDLKEELKKGRHYYNLPSLFGEELTYGSSSYTHRSPAFTITYPKHFKVTKPAADEVFRAKNSFGGLPVFGVLVKDRPNDIPLQALGKRYFTDEIKKHGTEVRLVYSKATEIGGATPANEVYFEWISKKNWPLKTLIVSTYHGDKMIFAGVTSLEHPETLREFLYSLTFK